MGGHKGIISQRQLWRERDGVVRGRMVALYLGCISAKSSSIDGLIERGREARRGEGRGSFVKGRGASGKG